MLLNKYYSSQVSLFLRYIKVSSNSFVLVMQTLKRSIDTNTINFVLYLSL